ncbi:hypothetical protein KIPB_010607 [Kipferlia bialata]|uniref:Uncharacterized protein n=1 Tax=Kipferlia bialata TaxID=797122 RepID=A0A9K3D5E2_9EUKA|nr:hypothetical protein KIPB_010607 [Kipferlia bialata]|eukprot:g10607.t1
MNKKTRVNKFVNPHETPSLVDILRYQYRPLQCKKGRVTLSMVCAPYIKRDWLSYERDVLGVLHLDDIEEAFLADQHFSMAPFPPAWATGPRKGRCPPSMFIGHIERPDCWKGQLCRDGSLTGDMFVGPSCDNPRKGNKTPSMLFRPGLEEECWTDLCNDGTLCGDLFAVCDAVPIDTSKLPSMPTPPMASGIGVSNH